MTSICVVVRKKAAAEFIVAGGGELPGGLCDIPGGPRAPVGPPAGREPMIMGKACEPGVGGIEAVVGVAVGCDVCSVGVCGVCGVDACDVCKFGVCGI